MFSTIIGIIGTICIVLGLTTFILTLNLDLVFLEILSYLTIALLLAVSNVQLSISFINNNIKFLLSILGLIALPFFELLTAKVHSTGDDPHGLFTAVGLSVGIISFLVAMNLRSSFIGGWALGFFYIGLNDLLIWKVVDRFNWLILFNFTLSVIFLGVLVLTEILNDRRSDSGYVGRSTVYPFDKGITVISSIVLGFCGLYASLYDFYRGFASTTMSIPCYLMFNCLYLAISWFVYETACHYKLTGLRSITTTNGIVYLLSKYFDLPWQNYPLSLMFFGSVLYILSLLLSKKDKSA